MWWFQLLRILRLLQWMRYCWIAIYISIWTATERRWCTLKVLNYDSRTLIYQNLKPVKKNPIPDTFTLCQYRILCNLIRQKRIKKEFFYFLLSELYNLSDWKKLNYSQMYELIFILTRYDFKKAEENWLWLI